jgi:hypothetical protein
LGGSVTAGIGTGEIARARAHAGNFAQRPLAIQIPVKSLWHYFTESLTISLKPPFLFLYKLGSLIVLRSNT